MLQLSMRLIKSKPSDSHLSPSAMNAHLEPQKLGSRAAKNSTGTLLDNEPWETAELFRIYGYLMSISDVIHRAKYDDPCLRCLVIGQYSYWNDQNGYASTDSGYISPDSASDWSKLGKYIGSNTSLQMLEFEYGDGRHFDFPGPTKTDLELLCRGLELNRSIKVLKINSCNLFGKELFAYLSPFLEGNQATRKVVIVNEDDQDYDVQLGAMRLLSDTLSKCKHITDLRFIECDIENEGLCLLSEGVKEAKSLTHFALEGVNIDKALSRVNEEALGQLMEALSCQSELVELSLKRNCIGQNACCGLISLLLERSDSKLQTIDLSENNIRNAQAVAIADALTTNRSLTRLDLSHNPISRRGWDAFARVLCNSSSIGDTFDSNHTLQDLGREGWRNGKFSISVDILSNLGLNEEENKGYVAKQKILLNHLWGHFNMKPFVEMELTVLPSLFSWFSGAPIVGYTDQSLYFIVKNMPWLSQKK